MIRILHILDGMSIGGGIQSFIMNLYRNIDRNNIQFDFLLHRRNAHSYEDEILKLGGKVYYIPGRKDGIIKNKKNLNDFFKTHKEYNIVHFHTSSLSYIEPLIAAKKNCIPTRIIHCHSSKINGKNKTIHNLLHLKNKTKIHKIANVYIACGEKAKDWAYKNTKAYKKAIIIKNGINIKKYAYNEQLRKKTRKKLQITDKYVICHIGRFEAVKNHDFIINMFKEARKKNRNLMLMLIGNGSLYDSVKENAELIGVKENILFLGTRNDIPELLQAADVFILPSLYEGLPIAVIEASASGLPVILSENITNEVIVKNNIIKKPIDKGYGGWIDAINSNNKRIIDNSNLYRAGFDISYVIEKICNIYRGLQ